MRLVLIAGVAWLCLAASLQAQTTTSSTKVTLDADSIAYADNGETVIAKGNVQLVYGDYQLRTNILIWYQQTDELQAQGQSRLTAPDGTIIYGDQLALRDHMQEASLRDIYTYFRERAAFLSAREGARKGNKYSLYQTFYTPCDCDKVVIGKRPLWNVRSWHSQLDRDAGLIEHWHAILQVKGVPIAYVPYFSYVSPEIDRKTGLLGPSYEDHDNLGHTFAQPIFFNLAPHYDLTLTPRHASAGGYIQEAEWRHLLPHGQYEIFTMGTFPKSRFKRNTGRSHSFRGSILGKGDFRTGNINYGFKVQTITDKSFFVDYKLPEYDVLENQLYFQSITDTSFLRADAVAYGTTILTQRNATRPRLLPWVQANHTPAVSVWGGTLKFYGDAIHIYREIGDDVVRGLLGINWQRHFYLRGGKLTTHAGWRSDIYDYRFDEPQNKAQPRRKDFTQTRHFITLATRLSYPLANYTRFGTYIIEPLTQITQTFGAAYHGRIRDEDGQVTELSADNLFDYDRFSGADREETGLRVAYGLRTQAQWSRAQAQVMLGQSWQAKPQQGYGLGSGLNQLRSDYVASAVLSGAGLSLRHTMRLAEHNFDTRRHETSLEYNNRLGATALGHVISHRVLDTQTRQRQGFARLRLNLGPYAVIQGDMVYDFHENRRFRSQLSIQYGDECTRFFVTYKRQHTMRRGLNGEKSIIFGITLKTLSSTNPSNLR